jgi:hypothetical protein
MNLAQNPAVLKKGCACSNLISFGTVLAILNFKIFRIVLQEGQVFGQTLDFLPSGL